MATWSHFVWMWRMSWSQVPKIAEKSRSVSCVFKRVEKIARKTSERKKKTQRNTFNTSEIGKLCRAKADRHSVAYEVCRRTNQIASFVRRRYCNLVWVKQKKNRNLKRKKCASISMWDWERKIEGMRDEWRNIWYYLISNHSRDGHCFHSIYGELVLELSIPRRTLLPKDTITIRMRAVPKCTVTFQEWLLELHVRCIHELYIILYRMHCGRSFEKETIRLQWVRVCLQLLSSGRTKRKFCIKCDGM